MSTPSDRSGAAPTAEGGRGGTRNERKSERPSLRPGGSESLVGEVLGGRYLIERLIGEGGMGAVYQAEHTHMRKRLAVKILHPEMSRLPEVVARFEREAMAAAHIEHPNVAAATDFGKLEDGSFFLVLEYVEGRSLRDDMNEGRLELGRALHIARQIASALGRAHSIGIVHRDLKPENVMLVAREGDADYVKVLDFGIAKVPVGELGGETKGQALTQLGMVYGTPEYMAPEQALGQPVDARADLYSLGVILFEMLTGVRPFEHESKVTLLGMHVTAPIPRMNARVPEANAPDEVDAIVSKLLSKDAAGRHADARELIESIDDATTRLLAQGRIAEVAVPNSLAGPRASGPRFTGVDMAVAVPPTSAFSPTKLALPPANAVHGLVSLVGSSFGQVARAAPPWASSPRVLGASALGVVVVAGLLIGAFAGGERAEVASVAAAKSAATANASATRADPKTDETIASAQANIEKGDFATAVEQLTAIEKTNPDRADVHMGLEKAHTGARNGREAMREAGLWLAADATAAADQKLEEDIRNAALVKETQDDAFSLLESKMGALGVDILYDIAFGTSGKMYPAAAGHAKRSLTANDVRGRASPALEVLLDLREAKTCDARHALLERVRDQGDARVLALLQQFQTARGCGFLNVADCYPCMRKDDLLSQAVTSVESRAAKTP
jgi:serine/threonine protein kinase